MPMVAIITPMETRSSIRVIALFLFLNIVAVIARERTPDRGNPIVAMDFVLVVSNFTCVGQIASAVATASQ